VTQGRGKLLPFGNGTQVLATMHPSSILRAPDEESRHREMKQFIDDLKIAARALIRQNVA
jgi:DNA polymerase